MPDTSANHDVVIVAAKRTPIGSFMGALSSFTAPELGSIAIKGVLESLSLDPKEVDEVYMGHVIQAGVGQAPARQAALLAGLPHAVPCTAINKVCASGMKAIMMAAQSIQSGDAKVIVAGGMESMSQIPHYLMKGRTGQKMGHQQLYDGLLKDGLTDYWDQCHMGVFADDTAKELGISREDQDAFAMESYTRSAKAWSDGKFNEEIVPVIIKDRNGIETIIDRDQEYDNVKFDKIAGLKPTFQKDGTVTAANASTLNDGACALILMSAEKAQSLGIQPLAKIVSYADAAIHPNRFTLAPAKALPLAAKKAGIHLTDLDYVELNEAFSVVGIANTQLMGLNPEKVNVNGGAVSLGHPLGCSGARIVTTLIHVLKQNNAEWGGASICNGGGGASAIIIKTL